jgi:hypothetical protein
MNFLFRPARFALCDVGLSKRLSEWTITSIMVAWTLASQLMSFDGIEEIGTSFILYGRLSVQAD